MVLITYSLLLFLEPSREKRLRRQLLIGISGRMNSIWRNNLPRSSRWRRGRRKSRRSRKSIWERKKRSSSNCIEFLKKVRKWEKKQWSKNRKIRYNYSEKSDKSKQKSWRKKLSKRRKICVTFRTKTNKTTNKSITSNERYSKPYQNAYNWI